MARFLHSLNTPERLIAADGILTFDLSVNPLSVVLLCLRPLNDTGTLSEFASYLNICGALNRVTISHLGEAVVSMSGRDLAALMYFRHGVMPPQANHDDTDDERRCVVLPLFLGKHAYDSRSCFPESRRGELVLECDFDIADTGYDGLRFSVETIELLGAKPKEWERKVTLTQTFAATGDNDLDMQPGNLNRGILLFGTTGFGGATPAPSLGRVSVRMDNSEVGYAATDFEVAHAIGSLWGRQPPAMDEHIHRVDATAAVATEPTTHQHFVGAGGWENYCFLDFDPTKDDEYSLDARSAARLSVRTNAETADLVRAIQVERITR